MWKVSGGEVGLVVVSEVVGAGTALVGLAVVVVSEGLGLEGEEVEEGSRSMSCASEIPEGELICGAREGRPLFPGGGPGGGGGKPSLVFPSAGVCPGEGEGAVVVIVGFWVVFVGAAWDGGCCWDVEAVDWEAAAAC